MLIKLFIRDYALSYWLLPCYTLSGHVPPRCRTKISGRIRRVAGGDIGNPIHTVSPRLMQRKLLAFFFGNGAPCPIASQLFHACNMHSNADDTATIYKTYEEWEKTPFGRHMSKYYNLRQNKYVYLNGKRRDQNEMVPKMMDFVPVGINNTEFPFLIMGRKEHIWAANVFYY
jgi:hypothetical protein